MLSYEDIEIDSEYNRGLGIEDATILNNPTYSTLETELNRQELEASDFGAEQTGDIGGEGSLLGMIVDPNHPNPLGYTLAELYGDDYVTPSEGFIKRITEYSKSFQNKNLNEVLKNEDSTKILDRSISELIVDEGATELPEGIKNGDYLTSDDVTDTRKWIVDNNQKRLFPDLSSFYGSGADWTKLKTRSIDIIKQIPDGEAAE